MAKTYAIFSVHDYKGGELSSSTNLDYETFIDELTDLFDFIELEDFSERRDRKIKKVLDSDDTDISTDIEYVVDKLTKEIEKKNFYSLYAGGEGFCGEVYEIEGSRLNCTDISDYLTDIAKCLIKDRSK